MSTHLDPEPSVSQARESLSTSIQNLLSQPLPSGAEVQGSFEKPEYIDDGYLLQPGDAGYQEGRAIAHTPSEITPAEAEALIAAGAIDRRENRKPRIQKW